ncbi:hypothetical protein PENTCL1PPCAC_357, partial [Pristionchus entomophagus]
YPAKESSRIVRLLAAVEHRSVLWDPGHPYFNREWLSTPLWEEVAKTTGPYPHQKEYTGLDAQADFLRNRKDYERFLCGIRERFGYAREMAFLGNEIIMLTDKEREPKSAKHSRRKAGAENMEAAPSLTAEVDVSDSMPSTSAAAAAAATRIHAVPADRDTFMAALYGRAPPQPRVTHPPTTREPAVCIGSTVFPVDQKQPRTMIPPAKKSVATGSLAAAAQQRQQQRHLQPREQRLPQPRIDAVLDRLHGGDDTKRNSHSLATISDIDEEDEEEEPSEGFEDNDDDGLQLLADAAAAEQGADAMQGTSDASVLVRAALARTAAAGLQVLQPVQPVTITAQEDAPDAASGAIVTAAAAAPAASTDAAVESSDDDIVMLEAPEATTAESAAVAARAAAARARLSAAHMARRARRAGSNDSDIMVEEIPAEDMTPHMYAIKFQNLIYHEHDAEKLLALVRGFQSISFSLPGEQSSESPGVAACKRRADEEEEDVEDGPSSSSSSPALKRNKKAEDDKSPKEEVKMRDIWKRAASSLEANEQSDFSLPQALIDGKQKVDIPSTRAATRASNAPLATRTRGRVAKNSDSIPKVKKERK